jgi:hypothetical protein
MCALELEREKAKETLGDWPFEIGLWVGAAATPNRMGFEGYKGPGADDTAYVKTRRFKQNDRNPSPIPIENCPWCGTKFTRDCFYLVPSPKRPIDLRVQCANHHCDFSGNRFLPIVGVDEPIYRRLPAFIIATVDKFAALPWTGGSEHSSVVCSVTMPMDSTDLAMVTAARSSLAAAFCRRTLSFRTNSI